MLDWLELEEAAWVRFLLQRCHWASDVMAYVFVMSSRPHGSSEPTSRHLCRNRKSHPSGPGDFLLVGVLLWWEWYNIVYFWLIFLHIWFFQIAWMCVCVNFFRCPEVLEKSEWSLNVLMLIPPLRCIFLSTVVLIPRVDLVTFCRNSPPAKKLHTKRTICTHTLVLLL